MSFCHSVKPAQKPRVAQGRAGLAKKTPRLLNSQLWIASTLDLPFFHRPCRQTWWKEFPGCMAIRSSGGSVSSSSTCYGLNHISQVIFVIIGTWNFQYCCTVNMKAVAAAFNDFTQLVTPVAIDISSSAITYHIFHENRFV